MRKCPMRKGECQDCGAREYEMCRETWEIVRSRQEQRLDNIIFVAMVLLFGALCLLLWADPSWIH